MQSVSYYSCDKVQAFSIYFFYSRCKITDTISDVIMLHFEKEIMQISPLSVILAILQGEKQSRYREQYVCKCKNCNMFTLLLHAHSQIINTNV